MKNIGTNFLGLFKKDGVFYKAALVSIFTTLLIMIVVMVKFLISPKVGDFVDIFERFLITFFGTFFSLFLFFSIYIYLNPDFIDRNDKDH